MKWISLGLTLCALLGSAAHAEELAFRTDINPALRYYQAFILARELPSADREFFFDKEWRGQRLPPRFGEIVGRYNPQLNAMRQAGQATAPCDWGIDGTPGPGTLLPHLALCKAMAMAAKQRVMWELQNGNESGAREDLVGMMVLGRNTSRDGTLIAALVECAIENIAVVTVAENFHAFSPATLQSVQDGFDAAPARGTIAGALTSTEKSCFHDWLEDRIVQMQKDYAGNDGKVMANLHDVFAFMADEANSNQWISVVTDAGTSDNVLKLVHDTDSYYTRAAEVLALPHPAFEEQAAQFRADMDKARNPLLKLSFPSILKSRTKEFRTLALQAMLRAAVAYKTKGQDGLRAVNDPFGQGPFRYERFLFEGADRGFRLTSAYAGRGTPETLIFVESDGPAFLCDGDKAGQPLSK